MPWPDKFNTCGGGGGGGSSTYSSNSNGTGGVGGASNGGTYIYTTTTGLVFCPLPDEQIEKTTRESPEVRPPEVIEEPKATGGVDGWALDRFRGIDFQPVCAGVGGVPKGPGRGQPDWPGSK